MATATSILAGAVELLSGNPHRLLVLAYSACAGIGVDTVWLLTGGREGVFWYALVGGVGAAANVFVLVIGASLPQQSAIVATLVLLAALAFVSGVFLAGVLGWWLLQALRRAGVVAVNDQVRSIEMAPARRPWLIAAGALVLLAGSAVYVALAHTGDPVKTARGPLPAPPSHVTISE